MRTSLLCKVNDRGNLFIASTTNSNHLISVWHKRIWTVNNALIFSILSLIFWQCMFLYDNYYIILMKCCTELGVQVCNGIIIVCLTVQAFIHDFTHIKGGCKEITLLLTEWSVLLTRSLCTYIIKKIMLLLTEWSECCV